MVGIARVIALLRALALISWRDVRSLGSIAGQNIFIFILLVALQPESAFFFLLLLLVILLFPLSSDPMEKIPVERRVAWPVARWEWGVIRFVSVGVEPCGMGGGGAPGKGGLALRGCDRGCGRVFVFDQAFWPADEWHIAGETSVANSSIARRDRRGDAAAVADNVAHARPLFRARFAGIDGALSILRESTRSRGAENYGLGGGAGSEYGGAGPFRH